jgi:hypothetical protein
MAALAKPMQRWGTEVTTDLPVLNARLKKASLHDDVG